LDNIYLCKKLNPNNNFNWEKADSISLKENVSGESPRLKTTVRSLWDEYNIYFQFICQDDEIVASYTNYNDPLYLEDVVEVFIDDNCDYKTYTEIEVNPLNTVLHYHIENNLNGIVLPFARTDKVIESTVTKNLTNKHFTVEFSIPMKEFVTSKNNPPEINDIWLINFYRIDRNPNGKDEYSAWSPTGAINFHLPNYFQKFKFVL
jgi:hypothetical protein